jgi:hypothetical protein
MDIKIGPFHNLAPPRKTTKNNRGRVLVERDIESYFKNACSKRGWTAEKFSSPQKRSVPDQIVSCDANEFFPLGLVFFAEIKRPGAQPTPSQMEDHTRRRTQGHLVFVVDSYEQVDIALDIVSYTLTTWVVADPPIWLLI